MQQVLNTVQHIPQKFEVFLGAVRELPWLQALAESIEETFKKFKEEAEKVYVANIHRQLCIWASEDNLYSP